jgi:hypothetical protein
MKLYWIVTTVDFERRYLETDASGSPAAFSPDKAAAVALPLKPAMRMLRQARRRLATHAHIEAAS